MQGQSSSTEQELSDFSLLDTNADQPDLESQFQSQNIFEGNQLRNTEANQNNEVTEESFLQSLMNPTPGWQKRKCNILLHVFAGTVVFSNVRSCKAPVNMWISVYFLLLICNIFFCELRERMNESLYWVTRHRGLKKIFNISTIFLKELMEQFWIGYGCTIYWSKDAEDCSQQPGNYMWCMLLFLIMGFLKLAVFLVIILVVIYLKVM